MTRAERRTLTRDRRDMERLLRHPGGVTRQFAAHALRTIDRAEREDPRPPRWLSLRLRLAGVRDAW